MMSVFALVGWLVAWLLVVCVRSFVCSWVVWLLACLIGVFVWLVLCLWWCGLLVKRLRVRFACLVVALGACCRVFKVCLDGWLCADLIVAFVCVV